METEFGFTLEELELNRNGWLSEDQQKKVQRQQWKERVILTVLVVLLSLTALGLFAFVLFLVEDDSIPTSMIWGFFYYVVIYGLAFIGAYRTYKRIARAEMQVIEGQVRMKVPPPPLFQPPKPAFYIQNGWRRFYFAYGDQFKAMKGLVYRFYVVQMGDINNPVILSVESSNE